MDYFLNHLIVSAIFIYPLWRMYRRAGFNPALSLLAFVPVVGSLIVVLLLAFVPWPAARVGGDG